jgi:ribosomal protein S1
MPMRHARRAPRYRSTVPTPQRGRGARTKDRDRLRLAMEHGECMTGHVENVQPHGARIRLGAQKGWVSRDHITIHRVGDVRTVLKAGMAVTVRVIAIGAQGQQITLSMRTE